MRNRLLIITTAGSCLLFANASALARTVEEIKQCIEGNVPDLSATQTILMRTVDRAGEASETRSRILWKRSEDESGRLLLRVIDPPTRRGAALLIIQRGEDEVEFYLHLPELRKTRRVARESIQGSMFGTDLSYEDFQRVQQMAEDERVELGAEGELDGRKVYTLKATLDEESSYQRSVTLVDQERCLPLRSEFYESGEKPRKVITMKEDRITKESFGWLPREIRIEDLEEGTHTEIIVEEFDAASEVLDADLSVAQLETSGR
jgi:hypothetical protein